MLPSSPHAGLGAIAERHPGSEKSKYVSAVQQSMSEAAVPTSSASQVSTNSARVQCSTASGWLGGGGSSRPPHSPPPPHAAPGLHAESTGSQHKFTCRHLEWSALARKTQH